MRPTANRWVQRASVILALLAAPTTSAAQDPFVLNDESGRFEQVFLAVDGIEEGTIKGRIWSPVQLVDGHAYGDELFVSEDEIVDWVMTKPDGSEEGNLIGKYIDRVRAGEGVGCSGESM